MTFEEQYLAFVKDVLETGERASNRTGIDTLFKHGLYMEIDMSDGFPLLTTKRVNWKSAFAEMLGFIRGYDNAADFRVLGTKVWDQNANENKEWLANPYRKGVDDLGLIYSSRWRKWKNWIPSLTGSTLVCSVVDQFKDVYTKLSKGIDDRRLIVEGWHPAELHLQCLPVCHKHHQYGIRGEYLDLALYVRSNDIGLGLVFNVAQYAWLLHLMAQITGHKPGKLLYFAFNAHIYVNHIDALKEQLKREPKDPPSLIIHPRCSDLKFLEETTIPIDQWTFIEGYDPHPALKMQMCV